MTIADSTFTDNHADDDGGAVRIEDQVPSLARTDGRTAQGAEADRVTITASSFGGDGEGDANSSSSNGGGLSITTGGPVTLAGNEFRGNRAVHYGGGADVAFCGVARVTGNTFEGNLVESRPVLERVAAGDFGGSALGGGLAIEGFGCSQEQGRTASEAPSEPDEIEQSGNALRANELETGIEGSGSGAGEFTSFAQLDSTDDTFHANTVSPGTIGSGGGLHIAAPGGKTISGVRRYFTCRPGRKSGPPKV